jgi:hypothetical protein
LTIYWTAAVTVWLQTVTAVFTAQTVNWCVPGLAMIAAESEVEVVSVNRLVESMWTRCNWKELRN